MENDSKEFMRVHVVLMGKLNASNEDGPITLPLLDFWYAPAFADESAPSHQQDAQQIRLVLGWQQLSDLGQEIQDLLQGRQTQESAPPPASVQ